MKIRARFTILFAVIVGVILFFFSLSIYYLSENYRTNDFHSRLKDHAISKLKLLLVTAGDTESPLYNHLNENYKETVFIMDTSGLVLFRDTTSHIPTKSIIDRVILKGTYTYSEEGAEYIGFIYSYKHSTYILFASASDEYGMNYVRNLRKTLIVRGLILMLIIFLSGWLYAGYFLKPILNIVQQTEKISSSNLNYRLQTKNIDDEIEQLTTTFNKMLERLETSFKIQKRFVSNASHELRNPLTAISGQIEVALMKERGKEEYRTILDSILKEIKHLRTLSNNLLELAISDVETLFQNFTDIRVDEILWSIKDELSIEKPEYNIHIYFDEIVDNEWFLTCKGEENLLRTALKNIIDNACKFSNNKTVDIKLALEKTNILIYFKDSGIGIPESNLKNIFEPFHRGSNVQGIPGSGVGLSLVQRIVKLHSGRISINSKPNEGTTVELSLPHLS